VHRRHEALVRLAQMPATVCPSTAHS
jgi:hypothetical protein